MKLKKLLKKLRKQDLPDYLSDSIEEFLESLKHAYPEDVDYGQEVIPFSFSDKAAKAYFSGTPLAELFHDCSFYVYGYEGCKEVVLAKNISVGAYPFAGISLDITKTGMACRFEVVSNTDSFHYMGGGIGTADSQNPMKFNSRSLCSTSGILMINGFRLKHDCF